MNKVKQAFPALPSGFYDILCDRLKEYEFTDNRLSKAVNHVVDTCIYPTPTIANFIIFDRESFEPDPPELPEEKKEFLRSKGIKI